MSYKEIMHFTIDILALDVCAHMQHSRARA
jgi:hypothetical protein